MLTEVLGSYPFLDGGDVLPWYQFRRDLSLDPLVVGLFERAMDLRIPHNYFALWVMAFLPCPAWITARGLEPAALRDAKTAPPR